MSALLSNNSNDLRILQELYDHRKIVKFVLNLIRILQEIDDHRIIVNIFIDFRQILLSSLIIPQFKCLLNSSRIVWLKNSCAIFPGLYHNSSTSRWPQNYCENFHLFRSEFFEPALLSKNSDDIRILQELYDHRILVIFVLDLIDQNSSRNRWPRNHCENFHLFRSEFF